jgi:hypothetical protein
VVYYSKYTTGSPQDDLILVFDCGKLYPRNNYFLNVIICNKIAFQKKILDEIIENAKKGKKTKIIYSSQLEMVLYDFIQNNISIHQHVLFKRSHFAHRNKIGTHY